MKEIFNQETYFNRIAEIATEFARSEDYKKVLDILLECYKRHGVVFTMGCGGSASTATHFAADLSKTTGGFKAISLVDNIPLVSAYTNDLGWGSVFKGQLDTWMTENDVLVGFSVHGGRVDWSQNLVGAMRVAKELGAKVIGFSGFDGGAMKQMSDVCLVVPTESEVYGTALIESMHVVIAHGLAFNLKEMINNE